MMCYYVIHMQKMARNCTIIGAWSRSEAQNAWLLYTVSHMSAIDFILCLLTHAITYFHMFIHFFYLILVTLKASLHHTDDPFRLLASALPLYKAISPSFAYHSLFYFISIQQLLFHICLKSLFVNEWLYIPSSQSSFKTAVTAVIPSALFSMYVCVWVGVRVCAFSE